ncbi:hypothetical protein DQ04_03041070 [Trypanosoma grayi]|uniref:hypothetical protein n=1 Tax=Trypanosoma grayi TaxID=71804 RepID=UPI0004F3EF8E|nr:hypothetical protein DQ04_03041070 [Trypanosoma grayi]KEG11036.1 hypothetical protein DQ04_03041070 [Trypanosoma grayi]
MPSPSSLKTAQAFLGNIPTEWVRRECTLDGVPHNEDGLRCLAANANWNGVAMLAEELSAKISGDTLTDVAARLRFYLVQVTAYFSMQRYAAAKKLVDALGDLGSDRFLDPATQESVVPFSLRFISALLPSYCGAVMDTQRRLYNLLEECQQHVGTTTGSTKAETTAKTAASMWKARLKRVQRALIVSHYESEQYSEALRLCETTIAAEHYDDEENEDYVVMRQMLHLQQLATLCLRCGNVFLAEDAFQAIEGLSTADESADVQQFHRFLAALNRALWLTFNDRIEEGASLFRDVARGTQDLCRGPANVAQTAPNMPTVSAPRKTVTAEEKAQSALCRAASRQLWVSAATSHLVCMLYETTQSKGPKAVMGGVIETLEEYLRHDPIGLLHSDAFLGNSVRLYTLEGDTRQKKVEMLSDLLEVFRCDRDSAPQLGKMV